MSQTTDLRDAYIQAELDILQHGQSSALNGRMLTAADLPSIIAGRKEWEARALAEARVNAGSGSLSVCTATRR